MKTKKISLPIIIVSAVAFMMIATGIASWIITISKDFKPEYSAAGEVISALDTTPEVYDGAIHLPKVINAEVVNTNNYKIKYLAPKSSMYMEVKFENGDPLSGPTNAGTYKIKYESVSNSNDYVEIEYKILKATPTVLTEGHPTLGSTIYGQLPSITPSTASVWATHPKHASSTSASPVEVEGTFTFKDENATRFTAYNGTSATATVSTTMKFIPTDSTNYEEVDVPGVEFTLEAVAKITDVYYGRIEDALSAANTAGSGTVIVLIKKNPTIYDHCSVNSGVTLLLSYDDTKFNANREGSNGSFADANSTNVGTYLLNNVTIAEGKILTVSGGTLNIDGVLGHAGQGLSAATTGNYAQFTLDTDAQIILNNNATFNCYGYVKEKTLNNGSKVSISGANVYMPFVVYDYRGGTNTVTVYKKGNIAPFTVFDMPNIQTELYLNHASANNATGASTLYGLVDLYANDAHNKDQIPVLSSNTSVAAVLNMTSGYIKVKYNPVSLGYTTGAQDTTRLEVHGDGKTANLTLTIKVMITVTVSLENVFFGVSYKYDIGFYDGTFLIQNKYKLLTGSKVYIDETATVNIDSGGQVIIYTTFNDKTHGGYIYPSKPAAEFIIDGTLNVKSGTLAGIVGTTNTGATLNVASTANIELSSIEGNSGSTSSTDAIQIGTGNTNVGEFIVVHVASEYLRGLTVSSGKNYSAFSSGLYKSLNGRWYSETCIIYYDANEGELSGNSFEPVNGNPYETPYTITKINTTNPTRNHYIFVGWYIDNACTIPLYTYNPDTLEYTLHTDQNQNIIYCNTYVYAKWIPILYDIEYEYIYNNCEKKGSVSGELKQFTIETNQSLPTPVHSEKYQFGGWFLDSEHTNPIGNILGSDFVSTGLKLYGLWYPEGTETYTVTYEMINNDDPEFNWEPKEIISFDVNSYTHWADCTKYDNTPSYKKYFGGWYIDKECTIVFDKTVHLVSDITLYGKWLDKHKVVLDWGEYGSENLSKIEYYVKNNATVPLNAHSFDPVDNSTYISHYVAKWSDGTTQYAAGTTSPAITSSVTYTLVKVESTRFYKVTITNNYTSVTITTSNGKIITGINDVTGSNSFTFANNAAQAAKIIYIQTGSSVSCSFTYHKSRYLGYDITNKTTNTQLYYEESYSRKPSDPSAFSLSAEYSIASSSGDSNGCVLPGAEILMDDGSIRNVEDIKVGDVVTTWSFEEGKLVSRPVIFVEHLSSVVIDKITLIFDDGTTIDLAFAQSFFSMDELKYFSIDINNVREYIGTNIMFIENGVPYSKKLISYKNEVIITDVYEIITAYDFSFIYDNILSMEPFLIYNLPFDINTNLKYDDNKMKEDIEKYGLYEYEEWKDYVSEEMFTLLNGKYFKVAISKGYFSKEYLIEIIEKYLTKDNLT